MDKPAVVTQPTTVHGHYAGEKPNNYLVASVINIICCFFLLGIIALIFSIQVDSSWSAGNYEDARSKANMAKILNIIGFIVGSVSWVIVLIIVIANVALRVAAEASLRSS